MADDEAEVIVCQRGERCPLARSPETFEQKTERNKRVSARYDELMREGKHGHYETMFRVVREEIERALCTDGDNVP